MLKTASKNIVPSPSYDFLKIAIRLLLQYARKLIIIAIPEIAFMYLLEKTTHPEVLKLGLYLPWANIYIFGLY